MRREARLASARIDGGAPGNRADRGRFASHIAPRNVVFEFPMIEKGEGQQTVTPHAILAVSIFCLRLPCAPGAFSPARGALHTPKNAKGRKRPSGCVERQQRPTEILPYERGGGREGSKADGPRWLARSIDGDASQLFALHA